MLVSGVKGDLLVIAQNHSVPESNHSGGIRSHIFFMGNHDDRPTLIMEVREHGHHFDCG